VTGGEERTLLQVRDNRVAPNHELRNDNIPLHLKYRDVGMAPRYSLRYQLSRGYKYNARTLRAKGYGNDAQLIEKSDQTRSAL